MPKAVRNARGNTAEFAVSMSIFFVMIFFPFVDLLGLATGAASVCLTAHQCAIRAATQQRYDDSLTEMEREANALMNSGFGRFVHLKPVGGYNGSGADLYIVATEFRAKQISTFGPNMPLPPPVDTLDNVYECTTKVTFDVGPTIAMVNLPCFSEVPGLGKPARITMTASRAAEYPEGLESKRSMASSRSVSAVPDIPWSDADDPRGSSWNYPQVYDKVTEVGQTIVNEDVVQVFADNPNWTVSPLDITPGAKIWIDYRADGKWTIGDSKVDANGIRDDLLGEIPRGSLIGRVGNGAPFMLGKEQWNFVPPGTGQLYLMCHDQPGDYGRNQGLVNVRIVVSR